MMFTPRNQLENMLSAAASQVIVGNNVAENTARIIALQAQLAMQSQRYSHQNPMSLWDDNWI